MKQRSGSHHPAGLVLPQPRAGHKLNKGAKRGSIGGHRSKLLTWILLFGSMASLGMAQGIPEPDLVMYGSVLNVRSNADLRLGYGTLTCTFRPLGGGNSITASVILTNIDNEFSYLLRIPCETPASGFAASTNTIQLTAAGITFDRSQISWNSNLLSFAQPSLTNTTFFSSDRGRIERVDLTVSTPIGIDPLNGLPVDWELSHFGRTGIDPLADPDGDGMNNMAEYRAGTDPNDPASALRFTEILPVTNGVLLKWLSADYKAYALQRKASLASGFVDLQTGIASTAPTNTFVDTTATGKGPFFYRLRLDDALSVAAPGLKFAAIQKDPLGGIRLNWFSATNQVYALQRCSNLKAGFVDVVTGIAGTPPVNSYRDAFATGAGPYFYRLRLAQ
jgi:hypothetical protein